MRAPLASLRDQPRPVEVSVDSVTYAVRCGGKLLDASAPWDVPTTGTVYGVALNYRQALEALGEAVNGLPYKAPPKAPILYVKPRNTWTAHGAAVLLPDDVPVVAVGPTLGVVIGRDATRVRSSDAGAVIAGYTVVNDLSVPHDSYYRPAIRQQCRDGFCPIGPAIVPRHAVGDTRTLGLRAYVNGAVRLTANLADLVRPVDILIQDITEFMTLAEGDVLLVGLPHALPLARAGDSIAVEVDHVGRIENRLQAREPGPSGSRT